MRWRSGAKELQMATAQQLAHYQAQAAMCDYTHLAALISRSEWEPTVEQLRSLIAAVSRAATKMTDLDGMDAVIACLDRGNDELDAVRVVAEEQA